MSRKLGPKTHIDTLKKNANRWLKAVRTGKTIALERLAKAWPQAPADLTLRDMQHALALEYGLASWVELKASLADRELARLPNDTQAEVILKSAWDGDLAAATRLAQRNPALAKHSLSLAVMFGDLAEVRRRLAADPDAARRREGSRNWEPLLYLAYGRLPLPAVSDHAVAMATALLDAGADPAARFDDGWGNPFTLLTGIIGMGEGVRPPHPKVIPLATLFLDRGTDPFDTQVFYDTSIVTDHVGWLEPLYARSVRRGDQHRWTQKPGEAAIGGMMAMSAVDYLLGNAVSYNHPVRCEWLIRHGANPNGVNAYSKLKHHEVAQRSGFAALADQLVEWGANPVVLKGQAVFEAACVRGDVGEVRRLGTRHPAYVNNTMGLHNAAERNDTAMTAALLTLGADVDSPGHSGFRPLHMAARRGAVDTARLLIEAGADVETRGSQHHATPLSAAVHFGQQAMVDLIAPISHDIFALAYIARIARLEEVLTKDPALVKAIHPDGITPLFALPDDEEDAVTVARILLDHGADPGWANSDGETADMAARERGLDEAADLIRSRRA